jgi:hypothetical protein
MLWLMLTSTGAATSLGPGNFGPFSPDGALLPLLVPTIGGKPVLHFRTVATGADQTIAPNYVSGGLVWSDDGKQAAFETNDGSTTAGATLRLWTAASGTARALTAAAPSAVQSYVTFVNGGTRLVYAGFAPPGGTPKTGTIADLYMMDLASSTAVRLGENLVGQFTPNTVAYVTADGKCAAFTSGYDSAGMIANVTAFPMTGALPAGATVLDYAANYWPILVSAKRVAYVIGGGVYTSTLPCAAGT